MMITDQGTIIRTPASDLSILSRSAGGVIVMRLPGDQYVANFTVVAKEEKSENDDLPDDENGEIEGVDEIEAVDTFETSETITEE